MNATVLVVGASGLVGSALLREFSQHCRTIGTFCHNAVPDLIHLDLRDCEEVRSVLHSVRPDVVLCPAADPNVEFCEAEPIATRQVNVDGLQNLLAETAEAGALLVYFSSEYVFDGKRGTYSETDACNPLNEYGRQKLECEHRIAAQLDRYIIGRISGVYGWEKQRKNFVVRVIESLMSGQSFQVPCDQMVTPTYAPNLARVAHRLVESGQQGLFHLSGSLPLLRTEFAQLIADVFDLDVSFLRPVPTAKLGLRAVRPLSAGLRIDKVQGLLDFPVAGPREGLEAMRRELNRQFAAGGERVPSCGLP
jgi:dTDP-4-dehydrorhamnose reductase